MQTRTEQAIRNDLFTSIFIKELIKELPTFEDLWKSKKDGGIIYRDFSIEDDELSMDELDYRNISEICFSVQPGGEDENIISVYFSVEDLEEHGFSFIKFVELFNPEDLKKIENNFPKLKSLLLFNHVDLHETEWWPKKIKKLAKQISEAFKSVIIDNYGN